MLELIFVGLGGGLGAIFRHCISLIPLEGDLPITTLVTNLLGAIVIGFIVGLADSTEGISKNHLLFIKTGFCGGFTTFSTFSLESMSLIESGKYIMAGSYILLSVILCLIGIIIGKKLSTRFAIS